MRGPEVTRSRSSSLIRLSTGSETGSAVTCRLRHLMTVPLPCRHAHAWKPGRCPDSLAATLATMSAADASAASGVS